MLSGVSFCLSLEASSSTVYSSTSKAPKLLEVIIDDKLKFDCHILTLCKKVAFKIHLLKKSSFMFDHRNSLQNASYFLQNGYSIFEFRSTLFFYLKDPCDIDRLEDFFRSAMESKISK